MFWHWQHIIYMHMASSCDKISVIALVVWDTGPVLQPSIWEWGYPPPQIQPILERWSCDDILWSPGDCLTPGPPRHVFCSRNVAITVKPSQPLVFSHHSKCDRMAVFSSLLSNLKVCVSFLASLLLLCIVVNQHNDIAICLFSKFILVHE